MPRSKTVVPGRARRKKVLKAAKGGFSGRSKLYKTALQTQQPRQQEDAAADAHQREPGGVVEVPLVLEHGGHEGDGPRRRGRRAGRRGGAAHSVM